MNPQAFAQFWVNSGNPALFNEIGLIRGLVYSRPSGSRHHCLMLKTQHGSAKSCKTFTLNKVDFDDQYMAAVKEAARVYGCEHKADELFSITRHRFLKRYDIQLKKVEMMVAIEP